MLTSIFVAFRSHAVGDRAQECDRVWRLVADTPLWGWSGRNSEYGHGTHCKDEHDLSTAPAGVTQRTRWKCCGHNWYVGYALALWD